MTDVVQRENQSQIALKHAQMTRQHQQTLTDIYQDTIARQHDLKHQLQAIEQLVAQGNSEAAKKYLAEYENKIEGSEVYVTGCRRRIVDSEAAGLQTKPYRAFLGTVSAKRFADQRC